MAKSFLLQGNRKISYNVYGAADGYPVIGCHGLAGSVDIDNLDEPLQTAGLRYIIMARPGYGESDFYEMETAASWADDMEALLSALAVKDFDVVGMSAGAVYAYALAARFPQRVKSIYIYSGIGAIYKPDVVALYPQSPELATAIELYKTGTLEEVATALYRQYIEPMPEETRQIPMIRDSIKGGCMGMAQTARLEFLPWGFEIEDVTQPVQMFHSRSDQEMPYAIAEKTLGCLQNGSMTTYENEDHSSETMLGDVMLKIIADHS